MQLKEFVILQQNSSSSNVPVSHRSRVSSLSPYSPASGSAPRLERHHSQLWYQTFNPAQTTQSTINENTINQSAVTDSAIDLIGHKQPNSGFKTASPQDYTNRRDLKEVRQTQVVVTGTKRKRIDMPPLPIGACEGVRHSQSTKFAGGIISFGPGKLQTATNTNLATTRSNSSKAESKRYQNQPIAEEDDEFDFLVSKLVKPESPPSNQPKTDRHHLDKKHQISGHFLESSCTFRPNSKNQPLNSRCSSKADGLQSIHNVVSAVQVEKVIFDGSQSLPSDIKPTSTGKSLSDLALQRFDSDLKSSAFTGGVKSNSLLPPMLTTSPPTNIHAKDQIIKSLQESLTLALKNVSSLQVELHGMQQSRPSNSLKLRDLEQTTINWSDLENDNKYLRQKISELEISNTDLQNDLKQLQHKHLEMIEYFNMVVAEQQKRISQQEHLVQTCLQLEQKVELFQTQNDKLQELVDLYEEQLKSLRRDTKTKIQEQSSRQFDGAISFSNKQPQIKPDQLVKLIQGLMKELQAETATEILNKTRDLKETQKRQSKDLRLILNLKMLMRDFTQQSPSMLADITDVSKQAMLSSLNVLEHEELPSAKEVWRWLKTLLQQYITLLKRSQI